MQEAVKGKMKTKHGDARINVGDGVDKRRITSQERVCMREGRLENIPASTINTFLNGGPSFSVDDET